MIHLNSGIAKWEPHITTDNGEQIGSKMNGVEFRAYETELKYRSQSDLIPGTTSTYNSVSFALRTEETDKLRGITADDTVIWNDFGYSVETTKEVKSCRRLGARDLVIYLKGGK